jgi:hypothetical protein
MERSAEPARRDEEWLEEVHNRATLDHLEL